MTANERQDAHPTTPVIRYGAVPVWPTFQVEFVSDHEAKVYRNFRETTHTPQASQPSVNIVADTLTEVRSQVLAAVIRGAGLVQRPVRFTTPEGLLFVHPDGLIENTATGAATHFVPSIPATAPLQDTDTVHILPAQTSSTDEAAETLEPAFGPAVEPTAEPKREPLQEQSLLKEAVVEIVAPPMPKMPPASALALLESEDARAPRSRRKFVLAGASALIVVAAALAVPPVVQGLSAPKTVSTVHAVPTSQARVWAPVAGRLTAISTDGKYGAVINGSTASVLALASGHVEATWKGGTTITASPDSSTTGFILSSGTTNARWTPSKGVTRVEVPAGGRLAKRAGTPFFVAGTGTKQTGVLLNGAVFKAPFPGAAPVDLVNPTTMLWARTGHAAVTANQQGRNAHSTILALPQKSSVLRRWVGATGNRILTVWEEKGKFTAVLHDGAGKVLTAMAVEATKDVSVSGPWVIAGNSVLELATAKVMPLPKGCTVQGIVGNFVHSSNAGKPVAIALKGTPIPATLNSPGTVVAISGTTAIVADATTVSGIHMPAS